MLLLLLCSAGLDAPAQMQIKHEAKQGVYAAAV